MPFRESGPLASKPAAVGTMRTSASTARAASSGSPGGTRDWIRPEAGGLAAASARAHQSQQLARCRPVARGDARAQGAIERLRERVVEDAPGAPEIRHPWALRDALRPPVGREQ